MRTCTHCNSLMGFDPRFNAFVCPHCGKKIQRMSLIHDGDISIVKTSSISNAIKKELVVIGKQK